MSKTILFVDDEVKILKWTGRALEEKDFLVLPYSDGKKAYTAIEEDLKYDLLLIDLSIPRFPGDEIAKLSKAKHPRTPIVVYSAYNHKLPEANASFHKSGSSENLVKLIGSLLR